MLILLLLVPMGRFWLAAAIKLSRFGESKTVKKSVILQVIVTLFILLILARKESFWLAAAVTKLLRFGRT